jgi:hypothetical protein
MYGANDPKLLPIVIARLPIQIVNDKGRYHSPKSTAKERRCGSRWLAFIVPSSPPGHWGRGCIHTSPKPTSGPELFSECRSIDLIVAPALHFVCCARNTPML